jgi:nicotinate-nucleotide pyrophosphorylase (carboxylating)
VRDGGALKRGDRFGIIRGSGALVRATVGNAPAAEPARPHGCPAPAHSILVAERVVLNFMQRMSGIATLTAAMAAAAAPARMLETRKTAPGLRLLDKWAVRIGGGENHRMGLFDMVMIKDNHIAAAGGITAAVARTAAYLRAQGLQHTPVEVEAATLDDVREALRSCPGGEGPPLEDACVTRIMLDNMDVETMRAAVALVAGRVETEASGNVTLESVPLIATTGVTFISSGALTHSVTALDISLNIEGEWAKRVALQ